VVYITDKIKACEPYEADVLYVSQGAPSTRDKTSETEDEVLVRKDAKTEEIKGFTILHFLKKSKNKSNSINLPFELSFK